MSKEFERPEDLNNEQLAELVINMLHQIMVHHTLYFKEAEHQFGMERALDIMGEAWKTSFNVQIKRISKILGFELENNIPKPLLDMPRQQILDLIKGIGTNWLSADGIWFQAVEKNYSVLDAQRCAGSCVHRFCTFEASSIKQLLGLNDYAGLEGLKKALRFRLYHQINAQSVIDESPDSLIFQMNECIVQDTRKRKGLDDYPCKSTGLVEYRSFAQTIDPRIETLCIGCPPDKHPKEWYCAWRFSLPQED